MRVTVKKVQFDVALNLVWVVLGLIVLGAAVGAQNQRWLRIVGTCLIVAALFPYISATDDVVRMDYAQSQQHSHQPTTSDNLMHLYQSMDTPIISDVPALVLTVFFVAFVFTPTTVRVSRHSPRVAGRSPPALLAA